jgi:mannose-6-phosphate isomerase-like protein (cupin superfamily)
MYRVINKYWGVENWIQVTKDYAFKRLNIDAGKKILNHYHAIKEETFYIAKGTGIVTFNNKEIHVTEGDIIHIEPNDRHSIEAITDLVVIEASTPYLEDSIREV